MEGEIVSNSIFPLSLPGLDIVIKRSSEWKTQAKEAWNGQETTIAQRNWPRWNYEVSFNLLRSNIALAELQQLEAFFNSMRGAYDDFLLVDPEYSSVTDQAFGTGDGSTKIFQLNRAIGTWLEPVWAVSNSPTPVLKSNGPVIGSGYTIGSTGLVTFTAAPAAAAALTWTGNYYMRCRFVDDSMSLERFLSKMWKSDSIHLISKVFA